MIDRTTRLDDAVRRYVRSGQTLMVGGFGRGGTPFSILEHLAVHHEHYRDLTLVKNDANEPDLGIGMLLRRGMAQRLVATHVGLNPELIDQLNRGEVEVEVVPQGIFAERIRAAGAGIPAFLTDVGLGTVVAENKRTVTMDGHEHLLERALPRDVALRCADRADPAGNCWWRGSNANMSVAMGTACDRVIVEAKQILPIGDIEPESVQLPSVFVDAVVQAVPRRHLQPTAAQGRP